MSNRSGKRAHNRYLYPGLRLRTQKAGASKEDSGIVRRRSILLVEDETGICGAIARHLTSLGYNVSVAAYRADGLRVQDVCSSHFLCRI